VVMPELSDSAFECELLVDFGSLLKASDPTEATPLSKEVQKCVSMKLVRASALGLEYIFLALEV
jgi:hypothetical protein